MTEQPRKPRSALDQVAPIVFLLGLSMFVNVLNGIDGVIRIVERITGTTDPTIGMVIFSTTAALTIAWAALGYRWIRAQRDA